MGSYNLANLAIVPVASTVAVGALNAARNWLGRSVSVLYRHDLLRPAGLGAHCHPGPAASGRCRHVRRLGLRHHRLVHGVVPDAVVLGVWLLGDSWAGAKSVILPVVVGATAVALVMGPALGLKCRAEGGRLLRTTFIQAPLLILFGLLGAALNGAVGAAWGFASAQVIGCILLWGHFLTSERHHARAAQLRGEPDPGETAAGPTPAAPPAVG